jgi:hypothetical protein
MMSNSVFAVKLSALMLHLLPGLRQSSFLEGVCQLPTTVLADLICASHAWY